MRSDAQHDRGPSLERRVFLKALAAAGAATAGLAAAESAPARRMTIDLVCGAIGVRADQEAAIDYARRHGFESVAPDAGQLARLEGAALEELLGKLREAKLAWGAAGLPVDFRGDESRFEEGLAELPRAAKGLQRAGVTRVGTWLSPAHETLTYVRNLRQHARRLARVAAVLGDHGLRFGLEYVGPKTSWTARRYPFVHTLAETLDLIAEIGRDNVGLVLDSWHWYTAGDTVEDLRALRQRDIVAVDLNDAPAGIARDEQIDSKRELPAATGVIDVAAFLGVLVALGYDGPVRAEPFNAALRALPPDEAVAATAKAMRRAFESVGPRE